MITRLRFIRGLVKDSANLRKELRNPKLKDGDRAVIERMLADNNRLISHFRDEVMPFVEKLGDADMQRFVEDYFFSAKSCLSAGRRLSRSLSADNVRRDIDHKLTKFWKL